MAIIIIDIVKLNLICSSRLEVSYRLVEEMLKRRNKAKQFTKK